MRLPRATAAVRQAVRRALTDQDSHVLVALSGGPDSTALAAAMLAVAGGRTVDVVSVDHQLQDGSARVAARAVAWAQSAGAAWADVVPVTVGGPGGPEAAARRARYAALDKVADARGADVVLLGHTRDDQAETVLLALARGSGTRTLAGMAARSGRYVRPLLTVSRDCTRASCVELGLTVTDDPHNVDPRFRRSRLRAELMPVLLDVLGEQAVSGLARSADLARDDADLLDELTAAALDAVLTDPPAGYCAAIDVAAYSDLPAALRRRLVRHVALSAGSPGGALASVHLRAVDALARQWHGQGPVSLPAGIQVERRCGTLLVTARAHPEPQ